MCTWVTNTLWNLTGVITLLTVSYCSILNFTGIFHSILQYFTNTRTFSIPA